MPSSSPPVTEVPFLELEPARDELPAEFDSAYHRVMDSGWYLLGLELEALEAQCQREVGMRGFPGGGESGRRALELADRAAFTAGLGRLGHEEDN